MLPKDSVGNVLSTGTIAVDSSGTLVRGSKPIAVIGVHDLVIVDTDEGLLVCSRDHAQQIKQVARYFNP